MYNNFVVQFRSNAERALGLAEIAAQDNTFGVGAVLVDRHGQPITERRNEFFNTGKLYPSRHAEMLVMQDYWTRLQAGERLPAADQCVIISTLDPCIRPVAKVGGIWARSGLGRMSWVQKPAMRLTMPAMEENLAA